MNPSANLPPRQATVNDALSRILTFKINDRDVSARDGETILSVASRYNIKIPTLCHLDGLSPYGGCRICVVELKQSGKLVPACITCPQEGAEILTHSQRVVESRKKILELIFSERNHVCAVCVSNGHCELQQLATDLGLTHIHYAYRYPHLAVDASHHRFVLDPNRCVLCLRCVRVCAEIEGAHTWDVMGRGISSQIIADLNQPWGSSPTCTSCGKCVQVCPTGALSEKGKSVAEMVKNQEFLPYLQEMRDKKHY